MPEPSILLIEDNPDDRDLAGLALSRAGSGHPLEVAADGADALDRLFDRETTLPVLVLLDLNLPRVDGRQLLREMRRHDRTQHVPVVVLTSSGAERDVLESYEAGANAYVVKPLDFHDFQAAIVSILDAWLGLHPTSAVDLVSAHPPAPTSQHDVLVALADEEERRVAAACYAPETGGVVHTAGTVAAANRTVDLVRDTLGHVHVDHHLPDGDATEVVRHLRLALDHRATAVVLTERTSDGPMRALHSPLPPGVRANACAVRPEDPADLPRELRALARFWLGRNRVPGNPNRGCR